MCHWSSKLLWNVGEQTAKRMPVHTKTSVLLTIWLRTRWQLPLLFSRRRPWSSGTDPDFVDSKNKYRLYIYYYLHMSISTDFTLFHYKCHVVKIYKYSTFKQLHIGIHSILVMEKSLWFFSLHMQAKFFCCIFRVVAIPTVRNVCRLCTCIFWKEQKILLIFIIAFITEKDLVLKWTDMFCSLNFK